MDSHPRKWLNCWFASVLLAASALGAEEAFWRSQGYAPAVGDSIALWQLHRLRACCNADVVVCLGESRMQAAISRDAFHAALPECGFAQLAIAGQGSSIGTLFSFASDEHFCCTIICSVVEPFLLQEQWDNQREYYAAPRHWQQIISAAPLALLQDTLVTLQPKLNLPALLRAACQGAGPQPTRTHMNFYRCRKVVFGADWPRSEIVMQATAQRTERYRATYELAGHLPPARFLQGIDEIAGAAVSIRNRGGNVVFLRLPSSGERLALEEDYHPKQEVWDEFAKRVGTTCIHFQDVPALSAFTCPDGSHLDHRDSVRFTKAVLAVLAERMLLVGSPHPNQVD